MREELGSLLAEGGDMRCTMRSEVEAALQSWGALAPRTSLPTARASSTAPSAAKPGEGVLIGDPEEADNGKERRSTTRESATPYREQSRSSTEGGESDHFAKIVKSATEGVDDDEDDNVSYSGFNDLTTFVRRRILQAAGCWEKWELAEEPPRTGRFAQFITGHVFDSIVTTIVVINTIWMGYVADLQIKDPNHDESFSMTGDWIFQAFYTIEILMKFSVHRQWFFCNASWKLSIFELSLVIVGFVRLSTASSSISALRALRLLNLARATRAVQAMAHLKHLRALVVCIQGSLSSLFWSLVTVFIVYSLFSLFLVQIIASYLMDTGESVEDTVFYNSFGSMAKSILTLHKACTGGDDWSEAYELIQITGAVGSAIYLFFIVFMSFALMNIITGIFVESAMLVLKPDAITLARETTRQEHLDAHKLDRLCRAVDADVSGKLTREQFEDGLRKKDIPLLLKSLGLQRYHLIEFFNHMAEVQDDGGQVDIPTFVNGCMLLKGTATNFDLQKVHAELKARAERHEQHLHTIMKILTEPE